MIILSVKKYLILLPFQFACTFFFSSFHFPDKNLLYNNEIIDEDRYPCVFPYLKVKRKHLSFCINYDDCSSFVDVLC